MVDNSTIGPNPWTVFVNSNNTVYFTSTYYGSIQGWLEGENNPIINITISLSNSFSLFVTDDDDIYVDNGALTGQVVEWTLNATSSIPVMYAGGACYGLFIDINDNLYCSIKDAHQVVKKLLSSSSINTLIAAGTGCPGPAPYMLFHPRGIFVDSNLGLYVADCGNNRIQYFKSGELNGVTVFGNGFTEDITLYCPSDIVLDADGYIFIVDSNNHRIIGSGPNGFRCLVGCFGTGSTQDELAFPQALSFDSSGNIFVADTGNSRIQKFLLSTNSCGK